MPGSGGSGEVITVRRGRTSGSRPSDNRPSRSDPGGKAPGSVGRMSRQSPARIETLTADPPPRSPVRSPRPPAARPRSRAPSTRFAIGPKPVGRISHELRDPPRIQPCAALPSRVAVQQAGQGRPDDPHTPRCTALIRPVLDRTWGRIDRQRPVARRSTPGRVGAARRRVEHPP